MLTVQIAKSVMKLCERFPASPDASAGELQEIFQHPRFTRGTQDERRRLMEQSAEAKYRSEIEYPWDHYFGIDLRPLLANKRILDLGCFTGGRGVAWFERYELAHLTGVDVDDVFIEAARIFAARRGIPGEFHVGFAEALPLEDASVDAVLSFDVLEHVQNGRSVNAMSMPRYWCDVQRGVVLWMTLVDPSTQAAERTPLKLLAAFA